jgi:hypothetical protein
MDAQPEQRYLYLAIGLILTNVFLVFLLPSFGINGWPLSRTWGFGSIKLFPIFVMPAYLIALLATVPSVSRLLLNFAAKITMSNKQLGIFVLACLLLFWIVRQKYAIFGDGYFWIDRLPPSGSALARGDVWPFAGYQQGLGWLTVQFDLNPEHVVQVASCLLGAPYIVFAGLFSREVAARRQQIQPCGAWLAAIVRSYTVLLRIRRNVCSSPGNHTRLCVSRNPLDQKRVFDGSSHTLCCRLHQHTQLDGRDHPCCDLPWLQKAQAVATQETHIPCLSGSIRNRRHLACFLGQR